MLCPLKLPYNAYRTRKLVSGEHYIDTGYTEHSVYLQMKTTSYMQEVSIKLANLIKTLPFGYSLIRKMCQHYGVIIHIY